MELTNKEWKEFFIEDIFEIKSGKRLIKNDMISGNIPFVGATELNNGITEFITNKNSSLDKNVLGVNYNGSVVYNFYHAYEAIFSDDVKRLSFREIKGNKYLYLFAKALILQQKSKYEYGYKFNGERMKRQKVLLPVNSKGKPDYAFMESYMRRKETELLKQYEKQVSEFESVVPLSEKEWKAFKLNSIFDVENCKCSNVSKLRDGNIPYIGATNRNNGLLKFVEYNKTLITKGNCIVFICDGEGSVGTSIYKKEDFIGSTTIKVGRNDKLNSYIGFFITTVADKVRSKYNFGFKRNDKHLKNELLLLPINSKGEPDFTYMENYMKALESEKITQYLEYRKKKTED